MGQHQFERIGATGRIDLPVRFDLTSSAQFRMPFVRLLVDDEMRRLVVNLSHLDYIDSMGIGTLISWDWSCQDKGKTLVLERCDAKILRAFRRAGVERWFEFAPPLN